MYKYFNMNNTTGYDSIIVPLSFQYGVNDALIRAVISQESNWDVGAYRAEPKINDASIGLMQILVKTAQWIAKDTTITGQQLYDPYTNISIGIKYLAKLLSRYGGDIKKAIAAYNAGSAKYRLNGDFINQDYVNRVWAFYQQYLGYAIVQNTINELISSQMTQGDSINTSEPTIDNLGNIVADSIDNSTADIPDIPDMGQIGDIDDPTAIELPFNPLIVGVIFGGVLILGGGFITIKRYMR